ncbi:hypothetical protein [Amycolatopsis thailandensis]|uniref:hypothetical protein n=1 Tax=Amycolatopsis thailandensis TaxID=589330 RepID=UPI001178A55D|nr:hypothetical protein [Amycolatopsis thailandensis]
MGFRPAVGGVYFDRWRKVAWLTAWRVSWFRCGRLDVAVVVEHVFGLLDAFTSYRAQLEHTIDHGTFKPPQRQIV